MLQNFATKAVECIFATTWKTTFNDCFWQQDYVKLSITKYIFCVEMKKTQSIANLVTFCKLLWMKKHTRYTYYKSVQLLENRWLKMQQLQKKLLSMIITAFDIWMYQVSKNRLHFLMWCDKDFFTPITKFKCYSEWTTVHLERDMIIMNTFWRALWYT